MAMVELDITLKKGGGATDAWMVIDNRDVVLTNGRNQHFPVDDEAPRHSYVVWVEGLKDAFASLTIKFNGETVASGKPTVAKGNRSRVEPGGFTLG